MNVIFNKIYIFDVVKKRLIQQNLKRELILLHRVI